MEIRSVRPEDAATIQAIYAPFVNDTAVSFEQEIPSVAEMAGRIAALVPHFPYLVVEDNEVLGYAYASPHRKRAAYRWSCEVSVYLAPSARGKGVGRTLYAELLAQARSHGLLNAYAGITLPNDASVGLHESLGFEAIGVYRDVGYKLGRFWDVGWWGLRLAEPEGSPREPGT